ncbi:DUF418 domain-containing protein [Staphylococcus xylosus]|uniref:DUF418 domain-containing protein n=1 Tax=Staphylococcus xylosus TaxID=1288 RepID=A0A939SS31_STAXY|nr:DUF418 domain-containing protein [Staphylococcus xylosus]
MCFLYYKIVISLIWLKYYKWGPLEYIWKLATYMKWMINITK